MVVLTDKHIRPECYTQYPQTIDDLRVVDTRKMVFVV